MPTLFSPKSFDLILLVGRVLAASLFLSSGVQMVFNPQATIAYANFRPADYANTNRFYVATQTSKGRLRFTQPGPEAAFRKRPGNPWRFTSDISTLEQRLTAEIAKAHVWHTIRMGVMMPATIGIMITAMKFIH